MLGLLVHVSDYLPEVVSCVFLWEVAEHVAWVWSFFDPSFGFVSVGCV